MPTCLDLGNAETAVTLSAGLLGAGPLKEVMRRTTDPSGCSERAQALLAALLLVVKGPAHGQQREKNEDEKLQKIGCAWQWDVKRPREADAKQKHEQKCERCLKRCESQMIDPAKSVPNRVDFNVAEAGDGRADEEDDGN